MCVCVSTWGVKGTKMSSLHSTINNVKSKLPFRSFFKALSTIVCKRASTQSTEIRQSHWRYRRPSTTSLFTWEHFYRALPLSISMALYCSYWTTFHIFTYKARLINWLDQYTGQYWYWRVCRPTEMSNVVTKQCLCYTAYPQKNNDGFIFFNVKSPTWYISWSQLLNNHILMKASGLCHCPCVNTV